MSDIFREVDEDIRREQAKRLWDKFGPYVLGAAVLIIVGTAGWRGYEYWQQTQAAASGDRFISALKLSDEGKHEEAIAALEGIVADGSGGYPALARFRIATEKAQAGDVTGAIAEFEAISATSSSTELRTLARVRAALLLADTASYEDLQSRIGDLAGVGNPWRHTAREALGLAAWRTENYETARGHFSDLANDQEAVPDLRQRAQLMLTLISSKIGDGVASAAVPAPAAEATSAAPSAEEVPSAPATENAASEETPAAADEAPVVGESSEADEAGEAVAPAGETLAENDEAPASEGQPADEEASADDESASVDSSADEAPAEEDVPAGESASQD